MSLDIDIESFINEVKKRPALYNTKIKEYSNKDLKKKMWEEIGELFIENWNNLEVTEKNEKCHFLLKKWKNLRTCFNREHNIQKNEQPGIRAKKRRRYFYFDRLSFLHEFIEGKETSNNFDMPNTNIDSEEDAKGTSLLQQTILKTATLRNKTLLQPTVLKTTTPRNTTLLQPTTILQTATPQHTTLLAPTILQTDLNTPQTTTLRQEKSEKKNFDKSLLQILRAIREEDREIDGDRYFLLSLLPSFKKFSEDQKFVARTEILNVMRRVHLAGVSTNANTLHCHEETSETSATEYFCKLSPQSNNSLQEFADDSQQNDGLEVWQNDSNGTLN